MNRFLDLSFFLDVAVCCQQSIVFGSVHITPDTFAFVVVNEYSDWYKKNYQELKLLNPTMPLLLRTTENAFPAVTTELSWTTDDLLRYMLQHSLFRNENGTVAEDRVEAAKAYLETDWALLRRERWAHPGFDPEMPFLEKRHEEYRNWRENRPDLVQSLGLYLQHKDAMEQQMAVVRSGPNREYERAENALLMCQRVDLWCAGEPEVERAIRHLWALGKRVNRLEPDLPEFITEYYPGAKDL